MKKVSLLAIVIAMLLTTSCTEAERSKIGGYGDEFKIELLNCSGEVVRTWISTGKVQSEANSDGYYFRDNATGKLIEVTGTLIITKQ